jgi:hypothetical protein
LTAPGEPAASPVHLIAFRQHQEAVEYLGEMTRLIAGLRPGWGQRVSLADDIPGFETALDEPADLVIASAHGQLYQPGIPFVPWIGDGSEDRARWAWLRDLGNTSGTRIGARAGIFWDVCNAGRPGFREVVDPFLRHRVVHIGVIGQIGYNDSISAGREILTALLQPRDPHITADAVAAAAGRAIRAASCRLHWTWLGKEEEE